MPDRHRQYQSNNWCWWEHNTGVISTSAVRTGDANREALRRRDGMVPSCPGRYGIEGEAMLNDSEAQRSWYSDTRGKAEVVIDLRSVCASALTFSLS